MLAKNKHQLIALAMLFCGTLLSSSAQHPIHFSSPNAFYSLNAYLQDSTDLPFAFRVNTVLDKNLKLERKWWVKPLVDITLGTELDNAPIYNAGLGLQFGYQSEKFEFWGRYAFIRSQLPTLQDAFLSGKRFMPFVGQAQYANQGLEGHLYQFCAAYKPSKFFTISAGRDAHFIGHGLQSTMLSDFTGPYYYLKLTTSFWKIRYHNIYSRQLAPDFNFSVQRLPNRLLSTGTQNWENFNGYLPKYSSTHYLEMRPWKNLSFGFFETVVWKPRDKFVNRGFEPNYLNPVIFYRPIEYAQGSSDKVMLGTNLHWQIFPSLAFYAQWQIDEFLLSEMRADFTKLINPDDNTIRYGWWANKHAGQIGINHQFQQNKWSFNTFVEFNYARPFNYSHASPQTSYTHHAFSMAHPLGANFFEGLFTTQITNNNFFCLISFNRSNIGLDYDKGVFGSDPFIPYQYRNKEHYNVTTQGINTILQSVDLQLAQQIKKWKGFYITLNFAHQQFENKSEKFNATFYQIGIKSFFLPRSQQFLVNR